MLIESANIFGLTPPSQAELTLCRSELKLAKVRLAGKIRHSTDISLNKFVCYMFLIITIIAST